ncbi:MAG TPA: NFACT RNA binding domain-containing protein [Longimicrobiaceae bacterium]|nr:NFACT RNA binding domain-containing protein [Longimicrobiaceae bacterium]
MSNPIRYDPVIVRALARELDERLRGRRARPSFLFAPDLSATLVLDAGEALRFDLHPTRGWTRIVPGPGEAEEEPEARVLGVSAPPDERVLFLDLLDPGSFSGARRRVVVELHTNQWNALVTAGEEERIVAVLRGRDAGERVLRIGAPYRPPPPSGRFGAEPTGREDAWDLWRTVMGRTAPADRPRAAVRNFAWLSTLSAGPVLGDAARSADETALEEAFGRWWELVAGEARSPVVLELRRGPQPFPVPLPGVPYRPAESLLAAMEAAASEGPVREVDEGREAERLLRAARRRLAAAEGRVRSLWREMESVGEAERMRRTGDLILANLHLVPPGASSARLPDFGGGQLEVEVELDPTLRPHQNAEAWYERARRRARAEERIPELLEAAEAEAARWREAVAAAEAEGGALPEWALRALERPSGRPAPKADEGPRLPYRVFRTSGGLEVRVGRSAKDNDLLTFGHSSPGDVWMHARSVPGSHVVLRWPDPTASPPARDLEEAAVLAALFSRARTSGLVAVDWTRRKHVRKPRGAPPGTVIPQQVRTLFVEPDPAVEARLRPGGPETPPERPP